MINTNSEKTVCLKGKMSYCPAWKELYMNEKSLKAILQIGENVAVEFKRCGNGMEHDVYESVCSFLNRFGGDILLGVKDNGEVIGVPSKAVPDMIRNFIRVISNPDLFSPTVYLEPEILKYEGSVMIHIHIPPSAEVHSFKKVIYDRVDDADVKVTSTSQIAAMYIRKQNIFTEKRIYPYVAMEDLRLDLLPGLRVMAVNHSMGSHPWKNMTDGELLRSAGLFGVDRAIGERGYNLAAVMLLGKDDVIRDIVPAYVAEALLRKVNVDRYDDRERIQTNLVESYDRLMEFGRKHLPDKFYLEDTYRKSLRNTIVREMIGNTLIHREFTSSYTAKFVIETNRMYVENANRAGREGIITPENLESNPKNPVIASFFRNIGYADQLGSGVRNLFRYTKLYSGKDPEFAEGDVFRITVPLNDNYSVDYMDQERTYYVMDERTYFKKYETDWRRSAAETSVIATDLVKNVTDSAKSATETSAGATNSAKSATEMNISSSDLTEKERRILRLVHQNPAITQKELEVTSGISLGTIKRILPRLQQKGILLRSGSRRAGTWKIADSIRK